MDTGTRVEVRSRYDQRWTRGFELEAAVSDHSVEGEVRMRYRVRRNSDRAVLPVLFEADEVREERRRSMWWM